jgi:hypothetical protein
MHPACVLLLTALLSIGEASAQELDPLSEARANYNAERYEAAIVAAASAREDHSLADEASVIFARSHLERYRQTRDTAHLTAAREALNAVDTARLSPADHCEFTVGMAEWLFFSDRFGAAAELFESALGDHDHELAAADRDRVLDWWATALDRHAQVTPGHRRNLYQRIVDRMSDELADRPGSLAAGYWLPAAARGLGNLDRAWSAAVAGWLRARSAPDHGAALRADLDRLMQTAIIPERAREMARPSGDPRAIEQGLTAEWELLKEQWN